MTNDQKELFHNMITGKILIDEPMHKHTTFGIGGPASALIYPKNKNELKLLLKKAKNELIPIFFAGSGTNLLVSDKGFDGIVVSLAKSFKQLEIQDSLKITAEAGVMLGHMVKEAIKRGIGGLEGLVGVPGTVGGALVMNAGAYGGEISNYLISTTVITHSGKEKMYYKEDIDFEYRYSNFKKDEIIVETCFQCRPGDLEKIKHNKKVSSDKRKSSQPLTIRSAGSIFKNPKDGQPAGYLIDNVGLKGTKCGDAEISLKHANFIVNHGNATSTDVINLIKLIRKTVQEKFNILLDLEIKLLGFEKEFQESNFYAHS